MTAPPRLTLVITGGLAVAGVAAVAMASLGPQLPEPANLPVLPSRLGDSRIGPPAPQPFPAAADRLVRSERRQLHTPSGDLQLVLVQAVVRAPDQRSVAALTKDSPLQLKGSRTRRVGSDQVVIGRLGDRTALQTCVTPRGAAVSRKDLSRLAPDSHLPSMTALMGLASQPVPGCMLVSLRAESPRGSTMIDADPEVHVIQGWTSLSPVLITEVRSSHR